MLKLFRIYSSNLIPHFSIFRYNRYKNDFSIDESSPNLNNQGQECKYFQQRIFIWSTMRTPSKSFEKTHEPPLLDDSPSETHYRHQKCFEKAHLSPILFTSFCFFPPLPPSLGRDIRGTAHVVMNSDARDRGHLRAFAHAHIFTGRPTG